MRINLLIIFVLISGSVCANIILPKVFGDNMVLQRNAGVEIWGWASPNEKVEIKCEWSQEVFSAITTNEAVWRIVIQTVEAGGPYTISVKGYNEIILRNVLLGEVWVCSGQSNMEMSAAWGINNAEAEIAGATDNRIRLFSVPKSSANVPQQDLVGGLWALCSPESMKDFSAVGYFFAQKLRTELGDIPIGLIASAWGGSPAEIWISEDVIMRDSVLTSEAAKLTTEQWAPNKPGLAYNAMIHPLIGFKLAGVLWYQGESNTGSRAYEHTFSALINSWRYAWNQSFPFYYVQIAPYNYGESYDGGAVVRDAQRRVLSMVPDTGMVMTSDISTVDDIHPKDKKSVGIRLASLALRNKYGKGPKLVSGPLFQNLEYNGHSVILEFDNADGLHFRHRGREQYELASQDGVFHPAMAKIVGNTVVVTCDVLTHPVYVRFAWGNTIQSGLFNSAGLPASTFKSP